MKLSKKTNISPDQPRTKKHLGQHFLRKPLVAEHMIRAVSITPETNVIEIGCGDGFLTRLILEHTPCKKLIVYEIDPEWAQYVAKKFADPRLDMHRENILDVDFSALAPHQPLVLLANLPYNITFPILFRILEHKALFREGVIMVQEEVAQKLVAKRGRKYSATSLLFQYHFELKLLDKIDPEAFRPPPKVHSRLVYFMPRLAPPPIPREEEFWRFLRTCFTSPRRTLRNNLKTTAYEVSRLDENTLNLRAQQLSWEELLALWNKLMVP